VPYLRAKADHAVGWRRVKKKRGAFCAPVDAFDVELAAVCMQLTIPSAVKVEWLTGGEDDSPRLIIRAARQQRHGVDDIVGRNLAG
jgi:hypothetical protein